MTGSSINQSTNMSKVISNQNLTRQHKIKFDKSIKNGQIIFGGYYLSVNTRLRPLSSWKNNETTYTPLEFILNHMKLFYICVNVNPYENHVENSITSSKNLRFF